MKRPLWKISVSTTAEAEDALSEMLTRILQKPATAHTDFRNGRTTVFAYLEAKLSLTQARKEIEAGIAELENLGLEVGRATISIQQVRRENWAESWKRHFKPLEISKALLVKPSWIKRKPKAGQAVVVLDPGLSFGTGKHPTTSFCLWELVRRRKVGQKQAFLDMGTGSGILAIAAVKLGYEPVEAFDFDPESVRVAKENARVNRVDSKMTLARRDLTKIPKRSARRFDVVCANLLSTLLIAERERIAARIKSGGILVVAGILAKEFHEVQGAFEELGFRLLRTKREKEWISGSFMAEENS